MKNLNENNSIQKSRHGCVTAWLIFMLIVNSLIAIVYLFFGNVMVQNFPGGISESMLILLTVLGIANVVFSVMLFNWKKIGFWGFLITSIIAFIINISIGLGIGQSITGLLGIAILYGVLQIKNDNLSAWDNLE